MDFPETSGHTVPVVVTPFSTSNRCHSALEGYTLWPVVHDLSHDPFKLIVLEHVFTDCEHATCESICLLYAVVHELCVCVCVICDVLLSVRVEGTCS